MVKSTIYKGIEFVRLSAMPKGEQELFQKTFNPHLYIKILIGEEIMHDCIQYKDYIAWYKEMYPRSKSTIALSREILQEEDLLVH